MSVSKRPPGRVSMRMSSVGALAPRGAQKWVRCSGCVKHAKTTSGGASNTLENCRPEFSSLTLIPIGTFFSALEVFEVLIELVEPLVPHPAVFVDPVRNIIKGGPFQMARPELRVTGSGNEAADLKHL